MKKVLLLLLCISLQTIVRAQLVNIADTNFRNYLQAHFPSAMNGSLMNPNNPQITSATSLQLDSLFITDLNGVQYFTSLTYLDCSNNLLHQLPSLPSGLTQLICKVNMLDSLTNLPTNLSLLNCASNHLSGLPGLPSTLTSLDCSYNQITQLDPYGPVLSNINCSNNQLDSLPAFTNVITYFDCSTNLLGSIPTLDTSLVELRVSNNPLFTLPVLNNGLTNLYCIRDSLTQLPTLPSSLNLLNCSGNSLDTLPTLPPYLGFLTCANTQLDSLPTLPTTLISLDCSYNTLPFLPTLPNGLTYLNCSFNNIPTLPVLPSGLQQLNYSSNPIATLPTLPPALTHLTWNQNPTNILPSLPSALFYLSANNNVFDSLPTLPNSLNFLSCQNDSLISLPALPNSLQELICSGNSISSLPSLPGGLISLFCSSNQLNQLPTLPATILSLQCDDNTSLHCLPPLPVIMNQLTLSNTAISCLPNFVQFTNSSSAVQTANIPLCTGSNGCPHAWNLAGNLHADTSVNCTLDSLNPGNGIKHLRVRLYQGSSMIDSFKITQAGNFSFRTPLNNTYDVMVDLGGAPLTVACPTSTIQTATPTIVDSMKDHLDFGIICNGLDAGIKSIMTDRFRPGMTSDIIIRGGDMAMYYNINCAANVQAQVVTILNGPITYLQPAPNALTPSSVVGNVITYYIPDLGAVDFSNAFSITVQTNVDATMGDQVCINTTLSGVVGDMNLSNNTKHQCFAVVNSFDPNSKEVVPNQNSKAGDELTYTIHFQNTGSDTAYKVVLVDTLSENLNLNTFQLVDASHDVEVVRSGRVVKFIFDDIMLSAKSQNEAMSMGWVQFTIRLKDDVTLYTKTRNQAFIYFDLNPPIITNYADNFVGMDTTLWVHKNPVMVPTAFSPNFDMHNDTWHILNTDYLIMKKVNVKLVLVKNRWGNVVFQSSGTDWEWKGEINEPGSVYSYQIIYDINGDMESVQNGTITMFTETKQ